MLEQGRNGKRGELARKTPKWTPRPKNQQSNIFSTGILSFEEADFREFGRGTQIRTVDLYGVNVSL